MPNHEGILDHKDWEEIKQDWQAKEALKASWKPQSPSSRSPTRLLRRVRSLVWPTRRKAQPDVPPAKLRPTAWLDGLRGFAAFLVYWHHHTLWAHDLGDRVVFEAAWGRNGVYRLAAFHGVRHFFSGGHFAVSAFFVISGYVLSSKPLSLIQAGEHDKLGDNLASALFRRWLRLYLPLIATTFLYMCSFHAFGGGLWIFTGEKQGNFRDELWHWYAELKNFSFVFNCGGQPWFSYNYHTWSIPVEFKGSIVTYTTLLALSRCTRNARLLCEAALIGYFMYVADGYYCAMFLAGVLLCDLDQLAAQQRLPDFLARLEPYKTFLYYHAFVASMYLGGVPASTQDVKDLRESRGWYYLSLLKPQAVFDYKWFYLFWAAVLLVAAVPRLPWLRRFFETRFCQHMGRISYAFYLVHGPILWTLGDRIYTAVGWVRPDQAEHLPWWVNRLPLSKRGPFGLEFSFLLPNFVLLLPLTLWVAELATRAFDEPAVRFAQWLYRRATGTGAGRQALSVKA